MNADVRRLLLILVVSFLFVQVNNACGQGTKLVSGDVYSTKENGQKEYIEGAIISVPGTGTGTRSGNGGHFSLAVSDTARVLIISFTGFAEDTESLANGENHISAHLVATRQLQEVIIRERLKSTEIGLLDPIKMEKIGQQELARAACCNLSESFETTPSVDLAFTDAVTGYKQIKLLGLSGANTLITRENIPDAQGLASITGLAFTPGPWIESIQLSKGPGSVVNGYGGVAGQINVELKKPFEGEKWFF